MTQNVSIYRIAILTCSELKLSMRVIQHFAVTEDTARKCGFLNTSPSDLIFDYELKKRSLGGWRGRFSCGITRGFPDSRDSP